MTFFIRKILLLLVVIVSVGVLAGCNTLADARMAKGKGKFKVYEATSDEAWAAAKKAIVAVGLQYVGENQAEKYILAQRGMTAFSYGENVAIFVEPLGERKTRIEVVSKKTMSTNLFVPNWSNKLFAAIGLELKPIE